MIMLRKKMWIGTIASLLTCQILAQPAFSAMPQSDVHVQFAPGAEIVMPVDPDNPSLPLEGGELGTGEAGPLTLNYISPLDFGARAISSELQIYPALTVKPFIQVSDLRGTGEGWEVEATASQFMGINGQTLQGSIISFNNGEAISANPALTAPKPNPLFDLPTDGLTAARVVTANAQEGLGTWVVRWYPSGGGENDNVTLTVQRGTATLENSMAVISWRLVTALNP